MTSRDFTAKEVASMLFIGALVAAGLMFVSSCTNVGPQGLRGPEGPAGPEGQQGRPGKDQPERFIWRPEVQVNCFFLMDLIGQDNVLESALTYEVLRYSNGDVDVSCQCSIGSAQNASGQNFFIASSEGASDGRCAARCDYRTAAEIVPGTVGTWMFTVPPSPRAVYDDPDNPGGLDGTTVRFGEGDCIATVMYDDGTWDNVTLAEVL